MNSDLYITEITDKKGKIEIEVIIEKRIRLFTK